MSTRGVFIIRKDGMDKGQRISCDVYPGGAGQDVIDLVKTTDLSVLYELMTEYDDMDIPEDEGSDIGEPEPFSYDSCMLSVKRKLPLPVSTSALEYIKNSLFCEYAYVIDLDQNQLLFFVGFQKQPQESNPYGTEALVPYGQKTEYYPCRMVSVFELEYICQACAGHIVHEMEKATKAKGNIRWYRTEDLTADDRQHAEFTLERRLLKDELQDLGQRMIRAADAIANCDPVSKRRLRKTKCIIIQVREAAKRLEEQIEIMQ